LDPLPDGYWFDGAHYVDFAGTPYEYHPDIEKFIHVYVEEQNGLYHEKMKHIQEVGASIRQLF
jgi:hypothetical protein